MRPAANWGSFERPAVYVDHWAICMFAEDEALQHRFVNAMARGGGTFIGSTTNLAEFTKAANPRHAALTEGLLDRLMPNVYLTNLDFVAARATYDAAIPPAPAREMLQLLGMRAFEAGTTISWKGFIGLSHTGRDILAPVFDNVNSENPERTECSTCRSRLR